MVVPSGMADSLNTGNLMGLAGAAAADLSNPEALFKKTAVPSDKSQDE